MSQLSKITSVATTPGSPGSPGSAGSPAMPGYFTTVTKQITTTAGAYPIYGYNAIVRAVVIVGYELFKNDVTTTYTEQVWVPPSPAIPGAPGAPGTRASTVTDYNIGWNAGAVSEVAYAGDCTLTLSVAASAVGVVAGFNGSNQGTGYKEIKHGLYFSRGKAQVYEGGAAKSGAVAFASADSFEIRRVGTAVTYWHNAALFWTSAVASTGMVFTDTSLYMGGDTILSASFVPVGTQPDLSATTAGATASASLLPLDTSASSLGYTSSSAQFLPLETAADVGQLAPAYTVSNGYFDFLIGASRVLTGENASASASFEPMTGASADRPYASASGLLAELQGVSLDKIPSFNVLVGRLSGAFRLTAIATQRAPSALKGALKPEAMRLRSFTGASGRMVSPPAQLAMTGAIEVLGHAQLVCPPMRLLASGVQQTSGSMQASLGGAVQLKAFGGASLEASAPRMRLAASASTMAAGTLRAKLKASRFRAKGFAGAVLTQRLSGRFTLQASGERVPTGEMRASLPTCRLLASASAASFGQARLRMPACRLKGTPNAARLAIAGVKLRAAGYAAALDAALREAWAMNLQGADEAAGTPPAHEVTHYTRYPFNQLVSFNGVNYGASDTGLFRLDGDTDAGLPIAWSFQTCATDFKSPQLKSLPEVFMSGKLGSGATVDVLVGEMADHTYQYTNVRGTPSQNHRFKFGRGMRSRLYALGVAGPDGDDFSLDGIEFAVTELSRKI